MISKPVSAVLLFTAVLTLASCTRAPEPEAKRQEDANSPAGKVGKAAHEVAVQTERAAKVTGRKLEKAAHQAHEGWKEAAREDRSKKTNK
jgi:hypothetical protein